MFIHDLVLGRLQEHRNVPRVFAESFRSQPLAIQLSFTKQNSKHHAFLSNINNLLRAFKTFTGCCV